MVKLMSKMLALGLVAAFALPAVAAQDGASSNQEKEEIGTLKIEGGVIMVSNDGGEFVSGVEDQRLLEDARLMVSENSKARVIFDDGCDQTYDEPGVYELDTGCAALLLLGSGSSPIVPALVTTGLVATWIALELDDDDGDRNEPPPPPTSR